MGRQAGISREAVFLPKVTTGFIDGYTDQWQSKSYHVVFD